MEYQNFSFFKTSCELKLLKNKSCIRKTLRFIPTDIRMGFNKLDDESSNDEQDLILTLCS